MYNILLLYTRPYEIVSIVRYIYLAQIYVCNITSLSNSNQSQNSVCIYQYYMASQNSSGPQTTRWDTLLLFSLPAQGQPDLANCHVLCEGPRSRYNYWPMLGHSQLGRLAGGLAPPVGAQHGSAATGAADEVATSWNIRRVQLKFQTFWL
jgi:hypothetical protein